MSGSRARRTPHEAYLLLLGQSSCRRSAAATGSCTSRTSTARWPARGRDGKPAGYTTRGPNWRCINLGEDVGEQTDVAAEHPEVVTRLNKFADAACVTLGDSAHKLRGTGYRKPQLFE